MGRPSSKSSEAMASGTACAYVLRPSPAGYQPQCDLGKGEHGILGSDPDVTGQRQFQPPAQSSAVDSPRIRGFRIFSPRMMVGGPAR